MATIASVRETYNTKFVDAHTKEHDQIMEAALAVAECLREGTAMDVYGIGGIPSGHVYAVLSQKLSLDSYLSLIRLLKAMGLVAESNHVLRYIGEDLHAAVN